jgi:hypothetical protein
MDKINSREAIDHDRRRFCSAAALTFTAAELGVVGAARAQTNPAPLSVIKPGTNTSFDPLKQIDAGVLNIGYAEPNSARDYPILGVVPGIRYWVAAAGCHCCCTFRDSHNRVDAVFRLASVVRLWN